MLAGGGGELMVFGPHTLGARCFTSIRLAVGRSVGFEK